MNIYLGFDEAAVSMKLYEISSFKIDSKKAYGKFGFDAWEYPFVMLLSNYICISHNILSILTF